jgi:MYXO-CTERM domain-containing protein
MNMRSPFLALVLASISVGCSSQTPVGDATSEYLAPGRIDKRKALPPAIAQRALRAARAGGTNTPLPFAAPNPVLTYYGGPLLESVEVYALFWGSKVDPMSVAGLPGFYQNISADVPYMQMLAEYGTPNAPYTVGHGTFKGSYVDANAPVGTPISPGSMVNTIGDQDVQAEISRLIDTGALPPNDGRNIYMVYFDQYTLVGGGTCTSFCAYHSSFTRNSANAYYAIMPDLGHNGCEQGCGSNTVLNNLYSTSSHELVEAMTDAAVGAAQSLGYPLAWYDNANGEIGDICTDWDGMANGYVVQSQWSNQSNGCRDHTETTKAGVTLNPADVPVAPGAVATITVTVDAGSTAPGPYTLELKGLGATTWPRTFTPPTIAAAGGTSTLKITVPATTGFSGPAGYSFPFHVGATDANGVHHYTAANLNVIQGAPTITTATPNTGSTIGGDTIALVGTNFAIDAQVFMCPGAGCTPANRVAATGVAQTDDKNLSFNTPAFAAGAALIQLVNPSDPTHPVTKAFTYAVAAMTAPTITTVTPASGPVAGGTIVEIQGTNFASGAPSKVFFGAKQVPAGSIQFNSSTDLIVFGNPSAAAPGAVAIKIVNPDNQQVTKANAFTYTAKNAPATALSINVNSGPTTGGTYVTIFGNNEMSGASVEFGGVPAQVMTVNPGNFIGVLSPAHAAGPVNVVVINPNAPPSTDTLTFTYNASSAPTITSVNPTFGPTAGGTVVTVSGTNFSQPAVTIGGQNVLVANSSTATSLSFSTPAHAAGSVPLVVTNGDNQTASTTFLYSDTPPPDMAIGADMAVPPDMSVPRDLSTVADLTTAAPDDLSGSGGGGGGGGSGGAGGSGGGGGSGGHGGCSMSGPATSSSSLFALAFVALAVGLRRRRRASDLQ